MRIYDGSSDRSFSPTNHTAFAVSCGRCSGSDVLTLRRRGREDWSLLFCVAGRMYIDDRILMPGQIWIYPPHIPQRYLVLREEGTEYRYLHFTGSDLPALLEGLQLPLCVPLDGSFCGGILEEIARTFSRDDLVSVLQREELILRLLSGLSEESVSGGRGSGMKRVTDAMEHSLSEPYDGKHYAEMMGLSVSRFNHLFSERNGVPPKRYFLTLRIKSACRMLESTDLPVWRIALLVGYADPLCFGQMFKRFKGVSPSGYRALYATSSPEGKTFCK